MLINFYGVCTHFWNHFVPGIPHRVVLANATSLNTGLLTGPFPLLLNPPGDPNNNPANPASWIHYSLMPHFPIITQTFPDGPTLPLRPVPGLLNDDGRLLVPSVLKITNAIPGMTYDATFTDDVASLKTFLTDYVPSTDVLTGGRVSAYFDLTGGTIGAVTKEPGGATRVTADVGTVNTPQLEITPLTVVDLEFTNIAIEISGSLNVSNVGVSCANSSKYDYLLHYLTAVAGMPRVLDAALPGMADDDPCDDARVALRKLLDTTDYPHEIPKIQTDVDTSASCSDSRYP